MKEWTVGIRAGQGAKCQDLRRAVRSSTPTRSVKLGKPVNPPGATADYVPLKVSGSSSRLGGIHRHRDGSSASQRVRTGSSPKVYPAMIGRGPALMIYLIEPKIGRRDDTSGRDALASGQRPKGAECLSLREDRHPRDKPGERVPRSKYMLNSVALNPGAFRSWSTPIAERS